MACYGDKLEAILCMICEECTKDIETVEQTHSMTVVLQKCDAIKGYSWVQCETGQDYNFMNFQHFTCNPDCMKNQVIGCITTHYQESDLIPVPTNQVQLHKKVLG